MPAQIPLVDLKAQYAALRGPLQEAMERVLASQHFIGGPEVEAFNREFSAWLGVSAVGVANGTDALYLAARALGLGPGDEFILPSHTFIATAEAIAQTGARPVFADVDPETYTIDVAHARRLVTPRTKAIVPVHLYGQPADLAALGELCREKDLWLIEDAAQAHGATFDGRRVGTFGDVATFSFYPGKNLGAFGDAGAVATNDPELLERIRRLANHGRRDKYLHEEEGVNSRLDALQAAVLRVKLKHLDAWNRRRQAIAREYERALEGAADIGLPIVGERRTHVYHLFVVQAADRDGVRTRLAQAGIETGIHYPVPLHLQPPYAKGSTPLAVTERLCSRILSLPMYPEMTSAQVETVARMVAPRVLEGQ